MHLANNIAGALLAFRRQVAVCKVVASQALMAGDPRAVENSERESREPAQVNLVGGQASGGADRIVVGELHVCQLRIPIALAFFDYHSQHLGQCVVNALHTTITARMVGAGDDFWNTKMLIYNVRKLGAGREAVVLDDATWTPPKGNVPVIRMLAVPSAVNPAAVTANMSARRLKRSVKSKYRCYPGA